MFVSFDAIPLSDFCSNWVIAGQKILGTNPRVLLYFGQMARSDRVRHLRFSGSRVLGQGEKSGFSQGILFD